MSDLLEIADTSQKTIQDGPSVNDVIETGKNLGHVIEQARKIVDEIRGVR